MNTRNYRGIAAMAVCLLAAPAIQPQTALAIESPSAAGVKPTEVVLDNGLTLLLVERRDQPVVAAGMFFDVGGVNDPRGKSGIAHLFEHMLFKGSSVVGTKDFDAERPFIEQQDHLRRDMIAEMNRMRVMKRRGEITDVLDPTQWTSKYTGMKKQYDQLVQSEREYVVNNELFNLYTTNGGAGLNAGTMEDLTMYFVQLPSNKLELFFWLEADRMSNGIMREFYVERFNVREERRLRVESTPTGKYDEAFNSLFWQSHPYGIPVIGWPSEVESISRDDVRDFYKIYYAPNNVKVVIVGDFDTDETIAMAKNYFGSIPRGTRAPDPVITEEPKPIAERRLSAEADTNPRVRLRYHSVAMGHTDEAALNVLSGLLSGKTGRLFKRLITSEDVAIGRPQAGNNSRKYAGSFEINVTVKEGHTPEEVEGIVLEEIDKLREGDISDRELQKVKNQVLASSVRRVKSNMGLMFQLGLYDTWYDWSYINTGPKRMLEVTTNDVHRVVKEFFNPKTRTVAIYRTKKKDDDVGAGDAELTAFLASVPVEQRDQTKMMIAQIEKMSEGFKLQQMVGMMEQGLDSDKISEEQSNVMKYMLKVAKKRLAELTSANKESD